MNKKPINQHKQMAAGNLNVGFSKGGLISNTKKARIGNDAAVKSKGGKVTTTSKKA